MLAAPPLAALRAELAADAPVLAALVAALDARDSDTAGHAGRVADLAVRLGRALGRPKVALTALRQMALLHDIGKIGVADRILQKPGTLTMAERALMERHPLIGATIVAPVLPLLLPGILHHHERYDGHGYPGRLAGLAIPFDARLLAVCDTFDALTSGRAYQAAKRVGVAIDVLRAGRGTQFDPAVVDQFVPLVG